MRDPCDYLFFFEIFKLILEKGCIEWNKDLIDEIVNKEEEEFKIEFLNYIKNRIDVQKEILKIFLINDLAEIIINYEIEGLF